MTRRAKLAGRLLLEGLRGALDFLDRIAVLLVVVALLLLGGIGNRLLNDERATKAQSANTRHAQREGEPTAVCLREALKRGVPILVNGAAGLEDAEKKSPPQARARVRLFVRLFRSVEQPLAEYVILQSVRFPHVKCPSPSGHLAKLLLTPTRPEGETP